MITDEDIERANDFIRDNSDALAKAKAERVYLDEFRKSKKAMLIRDASGTVQERESYAYSHAEYIEILNGLKEATHNEEKLKWLMVAAQVKIDTWRTQKASQRSGI